MSAQHIIITATLDDLTRELDAAAKDGYRVIQWISRPGLPERVLMGRETPVRKATKKGSK